MKLGPLTFQWACLVCVCRSTASASRAHGLAQYRHGQFAHAINAMSDASSVLGPAPRLVVAMAQHRCGRVAEARQTLAAAVLAHDWRAIQLLARDHNDWIYHVLRREAESLVLSDLPAFMEGKY